MRMSDVQQNFNVIKIVEDIFDFLGLKLFW